MRSLHCEGVPQQSRQLVLHGKRSPSPSSSLPPRHTPRLHRLHPPWYRQQPPLQVQLSLLHGLGSCRLRGGYQALPPVKLTPSLQLWTCVCKEISERSRNQHGRFTLYIYIDIYLVVGGGGTTNQVGDQRGMVTLSSYHDHMILSRELIILQSLHVQIETLRRELVYHRTNLSHGTAGI